MRSGHGTRAQATGARPRPDRGLVAGGRRTDGLRRDRRPGPRPYLGLRGEAEAILLAVLVIVDRVDADPLAEIDVDVAETTFRLVVLQGHVDEAGPGAGRPDADLAAARDALGDALAVVRALLARLTDD